MTTPRKPRARKATISRRAEVASEFEDDSEIEYLEPKPISGKLIGCLIGIAAFVMFVITLTIGGLVLWFIWYGRPDAAKPVPPPVPVGAYVDAEQLRRIMVGEKAADHALYLSKVCRGVAGRLETDFAAKQPIIDQRTEANDLFGIVGDFATAADGVSYPGLEVVIQDVAGKVFGDELAGGDLTTEDERKLLAAWGDLANAFAGVAK